VCVNALLTLLPIHFEWGDITFCRTALWERSIASKALLAAKLSNVQLLKLRRKRQPIESYASTSSSQSNRVLVCPGREIHVIGCWSSFSPPRRQASTHAAVWTGRKAYPLKLHASATFNIDIKTSYLTQFLQIPNSNNILYPCIDHWCVHTGRDVIFGGGVITCKVNAKTVDANDAFIAVANQR